MHVRTLGATLQMLPLSGRLSSRGAVAFTVHCFVSLLTWGGRMEELPVSTTAASDDCPRIRLYSTDRLSGPRASPKGQGQAVQHYTSHTNQGAPCLAKQ